ncbi:MAG: triose-phosphate isomerase, partial [Alphaproteobacteria bacterium]|nr:triose-phosphate isomerase [Alphaproteobacteria bacterium]
IPIICIGETYKEKLSKKTNLVISESLNALLPEKGKFIIAYEPRWAIGKGITPTLSEIKSVHKVIRNILNKKGFNNTPILYGASITQDNANAITNLPNVDGLLIGGASLKKETFIPIIESVR